MSKKIVFYSILAILFMVYGCSGKSNKKPKDPSTDTIAKNDQNIPQQTNDTTWINQVQFGFANEKGDMVLVDSNLYPTKPNSLIYALDSLGNKVSVTYKDFQPVGKDDTGRQLYFNFDNSPGSLYSSSGHMDPLQTVVLFTEDFFEKRSIIKLTRSDKKGLPEQVKKKIETDKNRKVKTSREIASIDGGSIYLMEFARKKDSALATLTLVYNEKYVYYDFPAMYDEQSTWRVDDGGEFWLDGIQILAVFKQQENIELIFDWIGAEGYNTQYLQQKDGIFKEVKTNYRYTSPL